MTPSASQHGTPPATPDAVTPLITDEHDSAIVEIISEFTQVFAFAKSRWAKFAEELHPELRAPGMMVLQTIIRRSPVTATELSQLLDMDKAMVSRQVTKLRELGFVVAAPSPEDGRVFLLTASESALHAVDDMRARSATAYHERFTSWDVDELGQLRNLLQRFNRERTITDRAEPRTHTAAVPTVARACDSDEAKSR